MTQREWRIFREDFDILIKEGSCPLPFRTFEESQLPYWLLSKVFDLGFVKPTPIQMQAIPAALAKRDLIALAPTGSGKSAAFLIPLAEYLFKLPKLTYDNLHLGPYAMLLAPTRELAVQLASVFKELAGNIRYSLLVGGVLF